MPGLNGTCEWRSSNLVARTLIFARHAPVPLSAVCRNCAETQHFYVRATTEVVAHCAPCNEFSYSQSFTIIVASSGCVVAVAIFAMLSKLLPNRATRNLDDLWRTATDVYSL